MGNSESNLTTQNVTQSEANNNNNINISSSSSSHNNNNHNNNTNNNDNAVEVPPRRRRRHLSSTHSTTASSLEMPDSDPWWWEIENENLILDQVPSNVTLAVAVAASESESVPTRQHVGEDDRLLKIVGSDTTTLKNVAVAAVDAAADAVADIAESQTENARVDIKSVVDVDVDVEVDVDVDVPREQTLEEFKEELRVKRLARQTAVQDLRDEISTLRRQLASAQAKTRTQRESNEREADSDALECDEPSNESELPSIDLRVDEDDTDPEARGRHANIELANAQLALQLANADNISLRAELGVVRRQVVTLKEVITCCKQMLAVKEEQCTQLKAKLQEIETSFGEREMKIMSNNLREEYERQLLNIRQLRQLYEERQRVAAAEYENLQRLISIKKDELIAEQEKTKNIEEHNQTLVKEVEAANNELAALRDEVREHKYEKGALKEEMSAVNTLFSQMVMGFNGKNNLDIDRLTEMLEENRALLNEMTQREGSCSDGATLPKLLFELVEQAAIAERAKSRSATPTPLTEDEAKLRATETQLSADTAIESAATATPTTTIDDDEGATSPSGGNDVTDCAVALFTTLAAAKQPASPGSPSSPSSPSSTASANKRHRKLLSGNGVAASAVSLKCYEPEIMGKVASAQEIVGNLPKVWKVLMELLSHHKNEQVKFEENAQDCYKSVKTANGTKTELSVSKTYIRLKDLILEKKALVKETNRLKTLNSHLDYRLNEQEKRLSAVSLELTKTWHLVGKMQRQHRQLHTQEQILRYQLQQKRRLLNELKDELEYCRRKWAAARAKNDESQVQCDDLRREFAKRKLEDANHSAESGYSDSGQQTDDEEQRAAAGSGAGNGAGDGAAVDAVDIKTVVDADALPATTAAITAVAVVAVVAATGNCRRKHLKESFEHTRKIKRMQSTSPGRAMAASMSGAAGGEDIVLRWNSAPPTCGWRERDDDDDDDDEDADEDDSDNDDFAEEHKDKESANGSGAIPKRSARSSRSKQRRGADARLASIVKSTIGDACVPDAASGDEQREERATRIQKLEEQCKSLIQQVLETSDNRERLEIQLCRFQDEIAPVQYAVPIDDFINRKRIERMTRASSAPATGTLTPREEEYTRKRSERLGRLEEESKQLLSRIRRTADRGHYLRCSLDRRIRHAPSREGSFESNTEEEPSSSTASKAEAEAEASSPVESDAEKAVTSKNVLTTNEEEFTARRAARLLRLEQESKLLMSQLSRNTQRGDSLGNKLDALHERYSSETGAEVATSVKESPASTEATPPLSVEQRLEDIEKVTANRQERLRILEQEGRELLERLSNTAERGEEMVNRIRAREAINQARNEILAAEAVEVASSGLTLNNVACSSIVDEELNSCVAVTTTPSQIAKQQGAIPKTQPQAQLCAAQRQQRAAEKLATNSSNNSAETQSASEERSEPRASSAAPEKQSETLEDMVRRLRSLPFPSGDDSAAMQAAESADHLMTEERHTDEHEQSGDDHQN